MDLSEYYMSNRAVAYVQFATEVVTKGRQSTNLSRVTATAKRERYSDEEHDYDKNDYRSRMITVTHFKK